MKRRRRRTLRALCNLGVAYAKGHGVAKDESKATEYYRRAADLGNPAAMNNLGLMYVNGLGVKKNLQTAIALFRQAADAENPEAMRNLAKAYREGVGVAADSREAEKWEKKADGSTNQ